MTEIYTSRLYAFIQTVFLPVIALGYWFCCYLVIPINTPGISVVFSYFIDAVMLFGAAILAYVIFNSFSQLGLFIRRTPVVIITNDQLHVYDLNLKRYRIFDWKDVVKIEDFNFRGSLSFDLYVREDERYQLLETSPWTRFKLKLAAISQRGAAVRIPASTLEVTPRTLYNMLQSHISNKTRAKL